MINLKINKNLLLTTLNNEIFELDDIIKRRTRGMEVESWVTDLITKRDELISIKNNVEKSVHNKVTIQIEDTIIF